MSQTCGYAKYTFALINYHIHYHDIGKIKSTAHLDESENVSFLPLTHANMQCVM